MTLASQDSLQSCQVRLADKYSPYDYVTVTNSHQRDVNNHSEDLPGIMCSCQMERKNKSGVLHNQGRLGFMESVMTQNVDTADYVASYRQVEVTGSVASDKQVEVTGSVVSDKQVEVTGYVASDKQVEVTGSVVSDKQVEVTGYVASDKQVEVTEVSRICLHAQDEAVCGIVVYHQHVYVVHLNGLIVYCYTLDGSLSHTYEHKSGENVIVSGMCLMMDGDTAQLIVSDTTNNALVWIAIDDITMTHHRTQQVGYRPRGSYCDEGN